jgi:hypothetical protein
LVRELELHVNGESRKLEVEETRSLLDVLRTELDLKAARFGCGTGQCGTCSVIVDGEDLAACQLEAGNLAGKRITTLEGVGTPQRPHPLQTAILELQAGRDRRGQGAPRPRPKSQPRRDRAGARLAPLPLRRPQPNPRRRGPGGAETARGGEAMSSAPARRAERLGRTR